MADEGIAENGVKDQVAGEPTSDKQNDVGSPPVESNSAPDSSGGAIPYSRFSEVIRERNEARERAALYEQRLRESVIPGSSVPQRESVLDVQAKRLAEKLKMDPVAAREVAEAAREIARAERQELESRISANEVNNWMGSLAAKHKDYAEIVPLMDREFAALDPQEKAYIASSPKRLEMFYNHVKSSVAEQKEKMAFEKGVEEAYRNKQVKSSVSSKPGSAAQPHEGELTLEKIRSLTPKQYAERQSEINALVAKLSSGRR